MNAAGNDIELVIQIEAGSDADAAEIEELALGLRRDLLELDVDDVAPATLTAPEGSKPGDPVSWQTMLVTLSASGGVLTTVIAGIGAWMRQRQSPPPLVIKIGKDELTLPAATDSERQQLVQAFIDRNERRRPGK